MGKVRGEVYEDAWEFFIENAGVVVFESLK
jgi:hypothetical protein